MKDLLETSTSTTKEWHSYYRALPTAFAALPSATRYGLTRTFSKEKLDFEDDASPTVSDLSSWSDEEMAYAHDHWTFKNPEVELAAQSHYLATNLDPTETISESLPLPTQGQVLSEKQQAWYQTFFKTYPEKWLELSPAIQWELKNNPKFTLPVKPPVTAAEVQDLPEDAIRFFYIDFTPSSFQDQARLTLIKRFAELNLELSPSIKSELKLLPRLDSIGSANRLTPYEKGLYAAVFELEPTRWETLSTDIQWVFKKDAPRKFPHLTLPTSPGKVNDLPEPIVKYFYENFSIVRASPIRNALIHRFYMLNYTLTKQIRSFLIPLVKTQVNPLGISFLPPDQVGVLETHQLTWLSEIYQSHRNAWITLPIAVQHAFKTKRASFPTLSYPISAHAVNELSDELIRAFHTSFDPSVISSKGRNLLDRNFGRANSLDDQNKALFNLPQSEKEAILKAFTKRFYTLKLSMPGGMQGKIYEMDALNDLITIQGLDHEQLNWYAAFYLQNSSNWEALPLELQWGLKSKDMDRFPPLYLVEDQLSRLALAGNQDNDNHGVLVADNTKLKLIRHLHSETDHFKVTSWVEWSLETQERLKNAFGILGLHHDFPNHPQVAASVQNLSPFALQAYHASFNPTLFPAAQRPAILTAFRTAFEAAGSSLTETIDLSAPDKLSVESLTWAYTIFSPVPASRLWAELPCKTQMILKTKCATSGIIPHTYSSPTLHEVQRTLTDTEVTQLYTQYNGEDSKASWIALSETCQRALNKRFQVSILTHSQMTPTTISDLHATAKTAYETHLTKPKNLSLWKDFSHAQQTAFNTEFAGNIPVTTTGDRVKHLANKHVWSNMTQRNLGIMASMASVAAVGLESTGIINLVPDIILETCLGIIGY